MVLVRRPSWIVLLLVAACGRVAFDPLVDVTDGGPPQSATVQTGSAMFVTGTSFIEVPITQVDLEHSLLVFSLAVVDPKPDDIKMTGRFLDTGQLRFERAGSEQGVSVRWTVVTWTGMTVRRGTGGIPNSTTMFTGVVDPPVDVARSFVIGTHRDQGNAFGDDEYVDFELTAPNEIVARNRIQNSVTTSIVWQVVELTAGVVHHGRTMIAPVTTLQLATTPSFDPTRAWLVYTHSASGGAPTEARHHAIGGRIVDGTQLVFERGGGSGTAHISWSLIELAAGTVEHVEATIPDGVGDWSVPIAPVDPAHSFVFGGSFGGTSGRSTSIDPGPGPAWVTGALSTNALRLERGISTGTTVSPWSVITLE